MRTVFCIDCEQAISLDSRLTVGEIITCSNCGTDMEVISVEPTELDWVFLEPVQREEGFAWEHGLGKTIEVTCGNA